MLFSVRTLTLLPQTYCSKSKHEYNLEIQVTEGRETTSSGYHLLS